MVWGRYFIFGSDEPLSKPYIQPGSLCNKDPYEDPYDPYTITYKEF